MKWCIEIHTAIILMIFSTTTANININNLTELTESWKQLSSFLLHWACDKMNAGADMCIIDWLSMVLRLRQHNIGYTADGF